MNTRAFTVQKKPKAKTNKKNPTQSRSEGCGRGHILESNMDLKRTDFVLYKITKKQQKKKSVCI